MTKKKNTKIETAENFDYVCFMPGNWFELRTFNKTKSIPYDLDNLKNEILSQINDRYEKLNFIDLKFYSKYPKQNIESIDFFINEQKMCQMSEFMTTETRHPIITFHGTNSFDTVKSIVDKGYIIPGMNPGALTVKKAHGSLYGTGVYSSPHFEKSIYYTTPNANYIYIVVNMLFMGVSKLIPFNSTMTPDIGSKPINGIYTDNSNTRMVFGLEQIISADPNRVVPVAIMKIKI